MRLSDAGSGLLLVAGVVLALFRYEPPPSAVAEVEWPTDPVEGRALVRAQGVAAFAAPELAPWLVSWGADDELSARAAAMGTASLLGSKPEGDVEAWSVRALAANEALRSEYAPDLEPLPFPPRTDIDPLVSVSIGAERARRSALGSQDALGEPSRIAAAIRLGAEVDPAWLERDGISGLVALELARRGDPADRALVERIASDGPTSADRVAALYAVQRLSR